MTTPAPRSGLAQNRDTPAVESFKSFNEFLRSKILELEFYFVGGAVMYQAFSADPGTAHIGSMFGSAALASEAIRDFAQREALPHDWVETGVRGVLVEGGNERAFLELSHLRVFQPLPAYVLAMKCVAMGLGEDNRAVEDVRYVLRGMNLTTTEQALAVVGQYFTERQLSPLTTSLLERVLSA